MTAAAASGARRAARAWRRARGERRAGARRASRRVLRGLRVARRRHGRARRRIDVAGGRIVAVRPARRAPRGTHLRGVTLPGLANAHSHAFQRALRGRTQRGGGQFWTWREDMYALAVAMTPDRCFELARGTYARDAARRDHVRRRVRLPALLSDALIAAANEVGIRLTLLDACYLAGGFGEPPNRRPTRASATATRSRGRSVSGAIKGAKVGAAIHSVRAVPAGPAGHRRRVRAREAAALPRLRAARRERGVPRRDRPHARAAAGRARRARAGLHRRPRHAPDARPTTWARPRSACARRPSATSPTASATPGPRLALGSDSHAIIDLFEEARAVELNLRLKTERRGHFTAPRAARRRHEPRVPGLGRRRPDRARLPRRPDHARPHFAAPGDRRTGHDARVDRVRRHRRGRHRHRRRMLIANIGTLVTNDPELGTLRDAAILFDDGRVAWVGTKTARGRGTSRIDAEGRALIPGFVDSHGHLVFAGDRAEEFAARMEGRPYTAGGIRTTVQATRAASDDALRANLDRLRPRGAALRHDDGRDQVRLRPHRPRRGARRCDRRRRTERHVPRRARRPARGTTRTPTSTSSRARCSTPARRTRPGSTCSARTARSTATQTRAILQAGIAQGPHAPRARQPAPPRPGHPARGRAGRRVRRPLHARHRRGHRRAGQLGHRRDPAARRRVLHPRAVPRRAPADRRGRQGRPRRRLQPRLQLHDQHPVLHRDRRARDAHDARRGRPRRHPGRREGAPAHRHRPPRPGGEGRRRPARSAVSHPPGLPAGWCRSWTPSSRRG